MGREDDRKLREESRRVDNAERREGIDEARKNLYQGGYAITGKHVDGLLKGESQVPTRVFVSALASFVNLNVVCPECIFSGALSIQL
jgi:hypothetical protein